MIPSARSESSTSASGDLYRLFQTLTGTSMDYYTPLRHRKMSFKEFMIEWVVTQHEHDARSRPP